MPRRGEAEGGGAATSVCLGSISLRNRSISPRLPVRCLPPQRITPRRLPVVQAPPSRHGGAVGEMPVPLMLVGAILDATVGRAGLGRASHSPRGPLEALGGSPRLASPSEPPARLSRRRRGRAWPKPCAASRPLRVSRVIANAPSLVLLALLAYDPVSSPRTAAAAGSNRRASLENSGGSGSAIGNGGAGRRHSSGGGDGCQFNSERPGSSGPGIYNF